MRSLLQRPSAVRFAARRVVGWRQHDSIVVLELEGAREPDATDIAAVLAGAPLDDALDRAILIVSVLESGPIRLRLLTGDAADRAVPARAIAARPPAADLPDAGLLDPDELQPAPLGVTTTAAEDDPEAVRSLHLASERHGGFGPDPEDVAVEVTLEPFGLAIKDAGGRTVVELATAQTGEVAGEYRTAPFAWVRWAGAGGGVEQAATVALALAPGERLAGLGERAGPLDLVGADWTVGPAVADPPPGNGRPPLLLSSGGYGVLVHTADGLSAELGTQAPAAYTLAVAGTDLDLLIVPSGWPRTALAAYARLTGRVAVPESGAFMALASGELAGRAEPVAALAAAHGASRPTAPPNTADELRGLLRRALSWGLATPGFWRAPLGAGRATGGRRDGAEQASAPAPPTPLQARWAQAALLCPLVGSGDSGDPAEQPPGGPVGAAAPDEVAALLADPRVRPYVLLRRRLLPYLLHCARETAQAGLPMLRPLLLEFSWDAAAAAVDDQFLLGRDVLVAPICSEAAGTVARSVRLPQYANWYDWWTGDFHQGGQTIEVAAPPDRLPIFARAGTVIPLARPAADDADGAGNDSAAEVARLLLFAPHDGAVGASVELAEDDLMGVEQERGERKARIFMEGIPRTVRDIEIVGLPTAATLVDASSPRIAIVPGDGGLPGLGGAWRSLTVALDAGAFTAGLELSW